MDPDNRRSFVVDNQEEHRPFIISEVELNFNDVKDHDVELVISDGQSLRRV